MGTIKDDETLNKLRAIADSPVRGCARMDCLQTSGAPVHHGHPMGGTEPHAFVDPADEPVFPIRAQDESAPEVVLDWLKRNPKAPPEKRERAVRFIADALDWPRKKVAD